MKHLFFSALFLFGLHICSAQDIFQQHGFDKAPLSLSNGKYNEFFINNEIVQIGSVLLNTQTNKVVAFVEEDTAQVKYLSDLNTRWLSIDPLAAKYPQVSPYVYVTNNPIIKIDPDGRDIIVINKSNGAFGFGHMAVLIGNDKTGWTFVSKDGRAPSTDPNDKGQDGTILTGGKSTYRVFNSQNDDAFKTLEGALSSEILKDYDQGFRIETTADQDTKAVSVATESAKSDYYVISSNCADVATDALESAGKNGGTVSLVVPGGIIPSTPITPNDRFNAIVETNKGETIEMQKKEEEDKEK